MIGPRRALLALVAAAATLAPLPALAQAWPSKPIRAIVPFPAGGAIDQIIQLVGPRLTEAWGQQIVMDHRPGANGMIGAQVAAKAAPDGYTLFMCSNASFSGNAALYPKLPYDPVKDFVAITVATTFPTILLVHPSVPARTVQEFIALARSKPGALNYASAGNGSSSHIAGEYFNAAAGVKMVHVPYKGNSLVLTDLVSGQVQVFFGNIPPAMPFVRSGQLRALAVTSAKRFAAVPDLPTVAESGLPGFEIGAWIGFCAPAGVPRDIVARLNAEIVKALRTPAVQEAFLKGGAETLPMTPEQAEAFVREDIARFARIVKAANIRLE